MIEVKKYVWEGVSLPSLLLVCLALDLLSDLAYALLAEECAARMRGWWKARRTILIVTLRCRFEFCEVEGGKPLCPIGEDGGPLASGYECPSHRDCFVSCTEAQWGSWIAAPGSPYNGQAFCERFPRVDASTIVPPEGMQWKYHAQAGKARVSRHNFDTIFTSVITIFQILTG
jgi:hypothetical protein